LANYNAAIGELNQRRDAALGFLRVSQPFYLAAGTSLLLDFVQDGLDIAIRIGGLITPDLSRAEAKGTWPLRRGRPRTANRTF
jgi:hypothetical protein